MNWKIIERIVYIATILIGVALYIRDEAKEKATIETTMVNFSDDVEEIKDKLNKHDGYWIEQMEINGRVITWIELDSK